MTQKTDLRNHFLSLRKGISAGRRQSAARALYNCLRDDQSTTVLSFVSFGSEIELALLNQHYASQGRLLLPKVNGDQIELYFVRDLQRDLLSPSSGPKEPNPMTCLKCSLDQIDIILVPGLAFDSSGYRLGYGKGHYDRFLARLTDIRTIGVGFLEQASETPLPRDPWDIPVSRVQLV